MARLLLCIAPKTRATFTEYSLMKIRSAVLENMGLPRPYAQSRPLTIAELDLEGPGPGEVLVQVAAAGLCHSDLSVIDGNRPRPTPMSLGHEASGVVVETGAGVAGLVPGDHVVMVFVPSCGQCIPCSEGRPALCEPGAAANGEGTPADRDPAPVAPGIADPPPPRRVGLRRVCNGLATIADQDRPRL